MTTPCIRPTGDLEALVTPRPQYGLWATYDGPNGRTRCYVLLGREGQRLALFFDVDEAHEAARLLNANPLPDRALGTSSHRST